MSKTEDKSLVSSKEVLDKTGISRATLNNYIKIGLIPRPIVRKPGEGFRNIKSLGYFPREVLETINRVKILKKEGKSMALIAEIMGGADRDVPGDVKDTSRDRHKNEKQSAKGRRSEKEIHEGELKLTLEGIRFPAYLVNFDFEIIWINREAEEKILHQKVRNIKDAELRNIFKLIFNWEFHCHVKNWRDVVSYHMSFAKIKFSRTWLARLYKGISGKEVNILEKVYDETPANSNHIIKDTLIGFLKKDGSTDRYRVYNMFFREGIFFVYVPLIN